MAWGWTRHHIERAANDFGVPVRRHLLVLLVESPPRIADGLRHQCSNIARDSLVKRRPLCPETNADLPRGVLLYTYMSSAASRVTPLLVACFLMLMPRAAFGTMWLEPTFIEMVKAAELIAIIRVEEGGETASRVRAVELIKGSAPKGDFVLVGYNYVAHSEPSRPEQWMRTGERYLVFVQRDSDDSPESRWRHLPHYRVPTPTTGDLPVKNGKVHGSWAYPSDPQAAPGVPLRIVLPLLRALFNPQDTAKMAEARRVLAAELTVDLARRGAGTAPPPEVAGRLDWLLSAQAEYGQVGTAQAVLYATRSKDAVLQLAAIRALRSLEPTDELFARIAELLAVRGNGAETFVQAEAARVLVALDSKGTRALPMLVRALPGSDPRDGGDLDVHRIRNAYESGRVVMIRALAQYGGKAAEQAVLTVMSEPAPTEGMLGAFVAFLRAHPSDGLRAMALRLYATAPRDALDDFHGAIAEIGDEALLDEILARYNHRDADLFAFAQALQAYALRAEPGDPRLTKAVVRVLRERRGEDLREYVAMTIPLGSAEAHRLAAAIDPSTLGDGGAETIQIAREARALQARGHRDPRANMRAWLGLLEKDAPVGFSTDYLRRELVCRTPSTLDAELIRRLSQEPDRSDELDAVIAALGAGGRAARDGSIAPFRCPGFAPTRNERAVSTASAHAAPPVSRTTAAMTGVAVRPQRAGCGAGCAARRGPSSGTSLILLALLAWVMRRDAFGASSIRTRSADN